MMLLFGQQHTIRETFYEDGGVAAMIMSKDTLAWMDLMSQHVGMGIAHLKILEG